MAARKTTPKATADKPRTTEDTALLARIDEARKYVPSGEALDLARIFDGEARTPWQTVPDDVPPTPESVGLSHLDDDQRRAFERAIENGNGRVTDDDLERGEELLEVVLRAFRAGERETLDRLPDVIARLRGLPQTAPEKLARYAESFRAYVDRARTIEARHEKVIALRRSKGRTDDAEPEKDRIAEYRAIRDAFARWLEEPAFYKVTAEIVRDELTSDEAKRTKRGAELAACRVAIAAGAFGTASDDDSGTERQLSRLHERMKKDQQRSAPGIAPQSLSRRRPKKARRKSRSSLKK